MANREKLTDQELNHMLEDLDVAELKAAQSSTKAAIGLRRLRKRLGLSQEEAAMKCDITPYTLNCLEHGEWNVDFKTLNRCIYRLAPDAVQSYSIKYKGEEFCPLPVNAYEQSFLQESEERRRAEDREACCKIDRCDREYGICPKCKEQIPIIALKQLNVCNMIASCSCGLAYVKQYKCDASRGYPLSSILDDFCEVLKKQ